MTIEIEAKMKLNDRHALEHRLAELEVKPLDAFSESNSFFDTPEGELKATDQGLRIRVEIRDHGESQISLTHKGPRSHGKLKSRSESELLVKDARKAAEFLKALGYQHVLTFEKKRVRYDLDKCRIELDTLPYLGDYIEIEGPSDDAVLAVRDKLGLGDTPLIKASYIAMLLAGQRDQKVPQTGSQVIRFEEKSLAAAAS